MIPFERRLAALEAARKLRFHREVFVIYDDDEADITEPKTVTTFSLISVFNSANGRVLMTSSGSRQPRPA
jgi:hypothetical protein